MKSKIIHKSHHVIELTTNQQESNPIRQRQLTSNNFQVKNLNSKAHNLHQKSQSFTNYGFRRVKQHIVEVRGLNEDFLDSKEIWGHFKFCAYLSKLSSLHKIQVIVDIFQHMKKWFFIYGLVKLQECIFVLKQRIQQTQMKGNQNSKVLIMYLSKKQHMTSNYQTKLEKERRMVEQFLIMFGNQIFERQKMMFSTISALEEFLDKILYRQTSSVHENQMLGISSKNSLKNGSMTGSNIDNSHYFTFRQRKVQKNIMIIDENASEVSSPKRYLATSVFISKESSQNDVNSISNISKNSPSINESLKNRNEISLSQLKNLLEQVIVNTQENSQKNSQVKFNYVSPQKDIRRLKRIMSTNVLKTPQKQPNVKFHFISPHHVNTPTEHNVLPKTSTLLGLSQELKFQKTSLNEFQSKNNTNISPYDQSQQKMKQTSTTLSTFRNNSANYISQHSPTQENLRTSISSQYNCGLNESSYRINLWKKAETINKFPMQIRQRTYSNVERKVSQTEQMNNNLSGTIHQFSFPSTSIFDVQQVEQVNKSQQKFNKITQQSNIITEKNSYSLDQMQNELDNLFDDGEGDSAGKQKEIEMLIEEFSLLLLD